MSVIYQGSQLPFKKKFDNQVYLFNDYIVFLCSIHLMAFTDAVGNIGDRYDYYGWSFAILIATLTFVNAIIIIRDICYQIYEDRKKK